eukprot:TRINITY_DN17821_c0_g1_i1.p1 TRINITY_DN17821_c0_g1~~TRINITY_DN17821_c0_g1_i1.p1  ORF type:complete len:490 (+),score=155.24 TRINITY_DN17821_c0_g1_i1:77-1546(+)
MPPGDAASAAVQLHVAARSASAAAGTGSPRHQASPPRLRDACRAARQAADALWRQRVLPPACREVQQLFERAPEAGVAVTVQVAQPNHESAHVVIVLVAGRAELVVKQRGHAAQKAAREEAHYLLAEALGAGGCVAPCVAVELELPRGGAASGAPRDLVAAAIEERWREEDGAAPPSVWVTVEAAQRAEGPPCSRLCGGLQTADLESAYLATPEGRWWYGAPKEPDRDPTDADFYAALTGADPEGVRLLCALAAVALQRDGGAPNLVVRSPPGGGCELICIDATRVFGGVPAPALALTKEEDDTGYCAYWYPAVLALPQAAGPFGPAAARGLLDADAAQLGQLLRGALGSAPGASDVQVEADVCGVEARLRHLQELLRADPQLSARAAAFAVVPKWDEDWAQAAASGALGPCQEIERYLAAGGDAQSWERRCARRRGARRCAQLCSVFAVCALVAAGTAAATGRGRPLLLAAQGCLADARERVAALAAR